MRDVIRRTTLGFLIGWFAQAQSSGQDSDELKAFTSWANSLPPDTFPEGGGALLNSYKAKLTQQGVSAAEADEVVARLRKSAVADRHFRLCFITSTMRAGIR